MKGDQLSCYCIELEYISYYKLMYCRSFTETSDHATNRSSWCNSLVGEPASTRYVNLINYFTITTPTQTTPCLINLKLGGIISTQSAIPNDWGEPPLQHEHAYLQDSITLG